MPPDRKPLIGRHRSTPTPGWQRANPTGQRGSGPTTGTNRGTSGWQRANPTGARGGTSLGSHRTPPTSTSSAPTLATQPGAYSYNNEDESPEYETYTLSDGGPYNNVDDAPVTYTTPDDGGLYNNDDAASAYETYTPSDGGLYNNIDDHSDPAGTPADLGYSYTSESPADLGYSYTSDAPADIGDSYTSESPADLGYSYTSEATGGPTSNESYTTILDTTAPVADAPHQYDAPPSTYGGSYTTFIPEAPVGAQAAPPAAPRPDAGLKRKERVAKYEGEDTGVTWRAASPEAFARRNGLDVSSPDFAARYEDYKKNSKAITTDYHTTPQQRDQTRLKEGQGGQVQATHLRRDGQDFSYSDEENVGWVMDPSTANIHTFDPGRAVTKGNGEKVTTHHTTPLAGGDVAGAGLMKIKDGHIHKVTDESGHYRPEADYTHQSVDQMAQRGLLDRQATPRDVRKHGTGEGNLSARVELSGYDPADPRQGKQWLKDKAYHQGALSLPYQAFLQTQGNEEQARKKVTMQEQLLSETPRLKSHKPSGRQDRGEAPATPAPAEEQSAPADHPFTYVPQDVAEQMIAASSGSHEEESDDEEASEAPPLDLSSVSYKLDPNDPDKRIWG